jgi:serine/threonine protein kinase
MPFSFEELDPWIEHLESLDGHLREAELQRLDQSNPGLAQHVRAVLRGAAWSDASPADGDVLHGVNRLDSPPNTCRVVGKFELVEKIGEGGMGEVYLAVNQDLREIRQAVKLIKPGLGSGAALREATTAAALATDPRIVAVRDVCELTWKASQSMRG